MEKQENDEQSLRTREQNGDVTCHLNCEWQIIQQHHTLKTYQKNKIAYIRSMIMFQETNLQQ